MLRKCSSLIVFGLPFNSGSIIAGMVCYSFILFLQLYILEKKQYKHANTLVLCVLFIFIGFSSWMMLPIRANANVIINENNPSSARELLAYYNLEQYPKTHLFYGPQFTDQYSGEDKNNPYSDAKPKYEKDYEKGEYVIVNDYKNANQNLQFRPCFNFTKNVGVQSMPKNYMLYSGYLDFKLKSEYQMENKIKVFNFRF